MDMNALLYKLFLWNFQLLLPGGFVSSKLLNHRWWSSIPQIGLLYFNWLTIRFLCTFGVIEMVDKQICSFLMITFIAITIVCFVKSISCKHILRSDHWKIVIRNTKLQPENDFVILEIRIFYKMVHMFLKFANDHSAILTFLII